jgi:hypothetical protein
MDNQGNRYGAFDGTVRGIGILRSQIDPKFSLRPGEWADARFEFVWDWDGRAVIGTSYDPMELTVREVDTVGPSQYRLGREHALTFRNPGSNGGTPVTNAVPAGGGAVVPVSGGAQGAAGTPVAATGGVAPQAGGAAGGPNAAAAAAQGVEGGATATGGVAQAVGANQTAAGANQVAGAASAVGGLFGGGGAAPASANAVPAGATGDPCGGNLRCYNAGPFTATVRQLTAVQSATSRANRTLSYNVEFRNVSGQPIILAYLARTNASTDNQGNIFADAGVTGIGTADGRSANTQFALNPGQARSATFNLWRRNTGTVLGTSWTWDVTIAELQVLANGQQVQTVREHAVHISDVAPGGSAGAPANPSQTIERLRGIFGR